MIIKVSETYVNISQVSFAKVNDDDSITLTFSFSKVRETCETEILDPVKLKFTGENAVRVRKYLDSIATNLYAQEDAHSYKGPKS